MDLQNKIILQIGPEKWAFPMEEGEGLIPLLRALQCGVRVTDCYDNESCKLLPVESGPLAASLSLPVDIVRTPEEFKALHKENLPPPMGAPF